MFNISNRAELETVVYTILILLHFFDNEIPLDRGLFWSVEFPLHTGLKFLGKY